jgi:NAD(P)H-hydrate epimerase
MMKGDHPMHFPTYTGDDMPYINTEQMIEVDRAMMEDFQISLMQMMENAGRNLATLARARFLDGDPRNKHVVVMAGSGGNGGGALVCARRLANWGAEVHVLVSKPAPQFTPVPAHQFDILQRMGVPVIVVEEQFAYTYPIDVVIDGVIGYSLKGAPRGTSKALIQWANGQPAPVLALDVPSGIDTATGVVYDPAIRAAATMTLALPKVGLRHPTVLPRIGELYLADISVPPALYRLPSLGLNVGAIFAKSELIRLG